MFLSNRCRTFSIQVILIYICSINFISITAYATSLHDSSTKIKTNVCTSPLCQKEASYLLSLMNQTADPCNDFHQFVCGKFISNTDVKIPEGKDILYTFRDVEEVVNDRLFKEFKESKEDDSVSLRKLKIFFANCQNNVVQEGADDLLEIINNAGGMPLLSPNKWNESNFNYTETIFTLKTYGYISEFPAKITITADIKNNTNYMLQLSYPDHGIKKEFFESEFKELREYYNDMVNKLVRLGADFNLAKKEMKDCLDFEVELYNIKSPSDVLKNISATYNRMTVEELSKMIPNIPWSQHLEKIFSLNNISVNKNELLLVYDPTALRKLGILLERTPKKVIANYLMWQFIRESSEYLLDNYTEKTTDDKATVCVKLTKLGHQLSAGALYAQKFGSPKVKTEVTELVVYLKNALKKMLLEANWMDEKTKKAAMDKAVEMDLSIGYPDEFLDNNKIDDYYQDLKIETGSFLRSVLNMSSFHVRNIERAFRESPSKNDWTSRVNEATIKAHYINFKNSLELPTAILQSPFFNAERPQYLNYGNLGKIIGHEFSHGFDNGGRQYDKTGAFQNWWEPSTEKDFDKKAQCFVSQYINYTINEVGASILGARTLNENIADSVGIKLAYHAYIDWMNSSNNVESKLPGLNYTSKQMFWISSASSFCEKHTELYILKEMIFDSHSPHEARINIPLWNSHEFAEDFQCVPGSRMNPVEKCTLW